MNKLGILGATAALLTVPVLGVSYAAAQGGADDPAGHVRHTGTDDPATHDAGDDHGRHAGRHHRTRGTDDRVVLRRATTDDHGRRHGGHGADDRGGDGHGGRHGEHGSDD